MARKPSYNRERSERTRAKQTKRDARLEQRHAAPAARKATESAASGLPEAATSPDKVGPALGALGRPVADPPHRVSGTRSGAARVVGRPTHRFDVGRIVRSETDPDRAIPPGTYEIMRQLPPDGGSRDLQYRVKATVDGHERIVRESDLI